jgi:hypothetical protein
MLKEFENHKRELIEEVKKEENEIRMNSLINQDEVPDSLRDELDLP